MTKASIHPLVLPAKKLWTVEEYHQMLEVGILSPDERVELIEGEVILMAAKKPPHVLVAQLAAQYLDRLLAGLAAVRRQDPIQLNDNEEPEPDVAIVLAPLRRYLERHPAPDEVFLIIEVADATLSFDTKKKAASYAKSQISDYWVVNAIARQVYIFRKPVLGEYAEKTIVSGSDIIRPLAFPEIEVAIREFFP